MNRFHAQRERGAVLMIGMVMLLMVTLIAVGLIRLSMRHTQVVNNEQVRTEATNAANYALDIVLNQSPETWNAYKGEQGKTEDVNVGITQSTDAADTSVPVQVHNLTNKRCRMITMAEITVKVDGVNQVPAKDSGCVTGDDSNQVTRYDESLPTNSSKPSLCASVLYEFEAAASAPQLLDANVKLKQGVEVRVDKSKVEGTTCG